VAESWAPSLEQVAGHIPTRTRDASQPGSDTMLVTFTASTTPTNEQAGRHIASACAEVGAAVAAVGGTIPETPTFLPKLAAHAAALRAAADIELAFPDRQADVSVYEQLDQRAKDALERLLEAIDDRGGEAEGSLLPRYVFPVPPWWGDHDL
jgi:hypothetical protein